MHNFDEILKRLEYDRITWIALQFTDLLGYLRQSLVQVKILSPDTFERGIVRFDGSSVNGFAKIEESDLVLKPDFKTYALIPWRNSVARLICDVYTQKSRLTRDPRYIAQKTDYYLADQGLKAFVSAELEFFVFDKVKVSVDSWRQSFEIYSSEGYSSRYPPFNRVKEGYYVPYPKNKYEDMMMEIGEILFKNFGIEVEVVHHEVAAFSQHEVNFRGGNVEFLGDAIQTTKFSIKALAHKRGVVATFMPKPIYGDNGSGMHVHISIWREEENIFYDPNDSYAYLSQVARYFIGGLIEHGRALSAIVSPTVNSYKRLIPGYEAPVYLVWSKSNRSAAIRIPMNGKPSSKTTRIEYRPPDPSANPYLAVAAIVMAGLDGIKKKIDPGEPINENVYKMLPEKRRALGIKELPRSLDEALDELESDNEWLKPVFSQDVIETYIELKRVEAKEISSYPSPVEIYSYIDI
ncbi:MAG: type I glutamate--ammonia ligase [Ignisphaera sp.]